MPSTLELCQKYFETKDLYKLFAIQKDAQEKEVKKAYYKLSLKVHPDRVSDDEKEEATEKFKLLTRVYNVLTDTGKRTLYNEKGIIDDDDETGNLTDWLALWKSIFKPISEDDIINFEKTYKGSELERTDIKKAYIQGKGDIDHMYNTVPFFNIDEEPRISQIVRELIDENEIPEYKIFTDEPAGKRMRRHKKYSREAKLVEKEKAKKKGLIEELNERQIARASNADSFFKNLLDKYGNEDDDDVIDFGQKKPKKKASKTKASTKAKMHQVKDGKVNTRASRSKAK